MQTPSQNDVVAQRSAGIFSELAGCVKNLRDTGSRSDLQDRLDRALYREQLALNKLAVMTRKLQTELRTYLSLHERGVETCSVELVADRLDDILEATND